MWYKPLLSYWCKWQSLCYGNGMSACRFPCCSPRTRRAVWVQWWWIQIQSARCPWQSPAKTNPNPLSAVAPPSRLIWWVCVCGWVGGGGAYMQVCVVVCILNMSVFEPVCASVCVCVHLSMCVCAFCVCVFVPIHWLYFHTFKCDWKSWLMSYIRNI